ncbi:hypothetical protein OPKNFCMD_4275 [Methylobacterium crusticola]|uniref:N-acetyltransferase domain-containing protein n=1 Tax=Methylobacterium crusticola TaxID=1697972 RepID=A0ABQ4R3H8_9HYPH|nr:GNAT family N-acetyltransferase [Methylobacterium crusticola]GJD51520.1 hypothetical protein OPKNFCMD_4275 [Methylobacterium crusticola]
MPHHEPAGATIRRLWPSDRAAIETHFRSLDQDSRFNRFMGAVSAAGAGAYAARSLQAEGLVFGAFVDGTLRGVGEVRPTAAGGLGSDAEAAFTVERDFRCRGLGTALAGRLSHASRNAGVKRLHVRCLSHNHPMRGLALKLGADLAVSGRELHATLALAPPTLFSLWSEGMESLLDVALAALAPRRAAAPA